MAKWEYCEVGNIEGRVRVSYLTEEGKGWDTHELAQRNVCNMAVALARLGREGWEVIAIHPAYGVGSTYLATSSYTWASGFSVAFLKRQLTGNEDDV